MTASQGFCETVISYRNDNIIPYSNPVREPTWDRIFRHEKRQNSRSELVHAQLDDTMYGYDYDNIGNRRMAVEGNESSIYEANELNQYTRIADGADTFEPLFDLAGNQTLVKTSTGTWRATYNAENRPIAFVKEDDSIVVECAYDYMGRRSYKKVTTNGTVTLHQRYIYRGYLQIAACDLTRSTTPNMWYILWDPTQPVATRPLAIQKDGVWYAYGWDLTKNICEIYGQTGYIRTLYAYTPYGSVTADGDVTQPIQWSSEFYDTELGLVYYNYRHYVPAIGKWLCREPLGENESHHLYSFLHNRIYGVDSLGNKWEEAPSGDLYRGDPFGHGQLPDGSPKDPHIDRKPRNGGTKYRYDLDLTPRNKAPKIPKKDIPMVLKISKKCASFLKKKLPFIGWCLIIKGFYDGYKEDGFWGGVRDAIF